jgi:hypothetical protein
MAKHAKPLTKILLALVLAASAVIALSVGAVAWVVVFGRRHESVEQRAERVIGAPLPPSASDVRFSDQGGMFGGDYLVSAAMTRDDFLGIVKRLGLRNRPDLLDYWPTALDNHSTPWWAVSSANDEDTYFGDSEESTYFVARYEGGRLYFKCHVY